MSVADAESLELLRLLEQGEDARSRADRASQADSRARAPPASDVRR